LNLICAEIVPCLFKLVADFINGDHIFDSILNKLSKTKNILSRLSPLLKGYLPFNKKDSYVFRGFIRKINLDEFGQLFFDRLNDRQLAIAVVLYVRAIPMIGRQPLRDCLDEWSEDNIVRVNSSLRANKEILSRCFRKFTVSKIKEIAAEYCVNLNI
jgi:hypothetical protein